MEQQLSVILCMTHQASEQVNILDAVGHCKILNKVCKTELKTVIRKMYSEHSEDWSKSKMLTASLSLAGNSCKSSCLTPIISFKLFTICLF